jgi:hypothetical protein
VGTDGATRYGGPAHMGLTQDIHKTTHTTTSYAKCMAHGQWIGCAQLAPLTAANIIVGSLVNKQDQTAACRHKASSLNCRSALVLPAATAFGAPGYKHTKRALQVVVGT